MDASDVQNLIEDHGIVVRWYHAVAASSAELDPFRDEPALSIGGDRVDAGPFGETYPEGTPLLVYFGKASFSAAAMAYGLVDAGNASLLLALPFRPAPWKGVDPLPSDLAAVYNAGDFVVFTGEPDAGGAPPPIAVDRFRINFGPGTRAQYWTPNNRPEPIVHHGRSIAWRLPVSKYTL